MTRKEVGEFVIVGQEKVTLLERKLVLKEAGDGSVQLECNGVILFAFKNGTHIVTTFPVVHDMFERTGLDSYYGNRGRVRLDTDG